MNRRLHNGFVRKTLENDKDGTMYLMVKKNLVSCMSLKSESNISRAFCVCTYTYVLITHICICMLRSNHPSRYHENQIIKAKLGWL